MIESDALLKNSPFQSDSTYHLSNTTPELLKFQLQEEHKTRLEQLLGDDSANETEYTYNEDYVNSSFNNHLQLKLDEGDLLVDELPSLISTPTSAKSEDSDNSMDEANQSKGLNYLNLKVLIENCVFEISKISKKSIISLKSIKKIKNLIEEKSELKNYYLSKLSISQQFINNLVDEDIDSTIIVKIVKSNNLLNMKINDLNTEINNLSTKLNNHNLSCLLLGYIEDIKISNNMNSLNMNSTSNANYKLIFDKLINYIVSLSVQRSINLPPPNDENNDSFDDKFNWIKQCVDLLINHSLNLNFDHTNLTIPSRETSPKVNENDTSDINNSILNDSSLFSINPPTNTQQTPNSKNNDQKVLNDYKTALNDLRFSHQYLIKEFEYSRENSLKIIQDYRKKISQLEKEISKYRDSNDDTVNASFNGKNISNSSFHDDNKDLEISKLKKQISLLKVNKLGEDSEADKSKSMSNGILRKEFKKIVNDIQDQYENELNQERLLRQNLQNELNKRSS